MVKENPNLRVTLVDQLLNFENMAEQAGTL